MALIVPITNFADDSLWRWFDTVQAKAVGIEIDECGSSTQYCCGFTFLVVRLPDSAVGERE